MSEPPHLSELLRASPLLLPSPSLPLSLKLSSSFPLSYIGYRCIVYHRFLYRRLRQMQLRQAHRNLNAKDQDSLWSYYPKGAKRVAHTGQLTAYGVSFKQPSGKKFEQTLLGGKRAVFAWIRAESFTLAPSAIPSNWEELRFNPKRGHQYFQDSAGRKIDFASAVMLANNGRAYFQR